MKLIQIKEFNKETVDEELAFELASLCVWNHYNEERFKKKGITIENGTPKGVKEGGSTHPWRDQLEEKGYVKTLTGVEITTFLEDKIRIFEDGRILFHWRTNSPHSEYEYISRHRATGKKRKAIKPTYAPNPIEVVQLYLDYGFFIFK